MNIKKTFFLMISLTIVFYAGFLFFSEVSDTEFIQIKFKYEYAPLIISLIIASWFPLYARWRLLCKNLQIFIPIKTDFLIFLSGFALTITPGKIGELFRTQLLKDKANTNRSNTIPVIFIEKFYDLIGAISFSCIGLATFPEIWIIILMGFILSIVIYFLINLNYFFKMFIDFFSKINITKNFTMSLIHSQSLLKNSTKPKIFFISFLLSVLYWTLVSISLIFIFEAVGINSIGASELVSSYVLSHFIGALSFIPGGIGVAETSFVGLITYHHVNLPLLAVIVVISRFFTLWFNIVVGFIALKISGGFSLRKLD